MTELCQYQKKQGFYRAAFDFQNTLKQFKQAEIPVFHHFSLGQYARECHLPAQTFVIGKVHRHAHVNVISKGRVAQADENGIKILSAPCTFINEIGAKRVLYVFEDTIWTTIHNNPSNTQDLALIEAEVIVPEYEVEDFIQQLHMKDLPQIGEK
ncbi:hypothetical protein [Acinetobacter sp. CFCC 10889]|uniref:hypothetical protein n=1 Tax=Acinetobacter sp. CFCC 10889 TaxID=1775557 RepID=UPI000DCFD1B2|nr:hypothetical protein [Acinetobacter sp. CFCC 10889]